MKALLAILLFFALSQPASACRHFSIWRYNFPQPCPIGSPTAKTASEPVTQEIPLPALNNIDWGKVGDDRLAAVARMHALNGGR
jgi:hypothetical protein